MKARFIRSSEKDKIVEELNFFYGIEELPYLLIETGKKKIRAFSGSLSKDEIIALAKIANIEIVGMYLISKKDEEPRINFDALSLLKEQITKNLLEINEKQLNLWLRGNDLEIVTNKGPVILKHEEDLVGLGKSNGERIFNYVPKERKIKSALRKPENPQGF